MTGKAVDYPSLKAVATLIDPTELTNVDRGWQINKFTHFAYNYLFHEFLNSNSRRAYI